MADYGFLSRLLHHLALASPAIAEASFDADQSTSKTTNPATRPVFVSGLARAGTTVLMRALYETGAFCSLTYREMPFVLAPRLWGKLSKHSARDMEQKERAHGDGLLVDFDSPEALEEVFWRVFCGEDYILPDRLIPMSADEEVTEKFRAYIAAIVDHHGGKRYLSKNNNNILRFDSILSAFPDAAIIMPFREPIAHARSLLQQHQKFIEEHQNDPFSRKYMTWLVHHEFGGDHRRFVFSDDASSPYQPDDINYWLALWTHVYTHLHASIQQRKNQILPLCYEDLCSGDDQCWQRLANFAGLDAAMPDHFRIPNHAPANGVDPALLANANAIYEQLKS